MVLTYYIMHLMFCCFLVMTFSVRCFSSIKQILQACKTFQGRGKGSLHCQFGCVVYSDFIVYSRYSSLVWGLDSHKTLWQWMNRSTLGAEPPRRHNTLSVYHILGGPSPSILGCCNTELQSLRNSSSSHSSVRLEIVNKQVYMNMNA